MSAGKNYLHFSLAETTTIIVFLVSSDIYATIWVQSGRFGKLNKRVTFPERLDLSPYMSETGNGTDFYNLYAVVVHMDMLNASFFGHYICYTKDFCGNWCRIDDCKVATVELDEVLSQGAYMLLYSRSALLFHITFERKTSGRHDDGHVLTILVYARPSCLNRVEPLRKEEQGVVEMAPEVTACPKEPAGSLLSDGSSESKVSSCEEELSSVTEDAAVQAFNCEGEFSSIGEDQDEVRSGPTSKDIKVNVNGSCIDVKESVLVVEDQDMVGSGASLSPKDVEVHSSESCNEVNDSVLVIEQAHELVSGPGVTTLTDTYSAEACTLKHEQPAPVSYVENRAGAGQCLIMDPLDEGSVPTQNHFCESRKTGCDDLITTLRSGEWTDEANPVDCSSKRENAESGIEGAARKLDGSSSFGLRPLTPPRYELRDSFIESSTPTQNHVWEKSEKCCDVSVGTLWSGDVLEGSYPVNIRGKQESVVSGQSLPSSTGIEDAAKKLCGSNPSGAKLRPLFPFLTEGPPCTLSDSSCEGTLRTQNFISEKSEMCRHLSVGTSWPDEVLDETHLEISSDKLETVVYGPSFPLSSITENAAGIYQGKSSSAAKPLFSPGSLEEPPQCVLTDPLIQGFAQKKSEKYQDVSISSGANSKPFSPPGFFRKLPQCVSTDSLLEGSATHNLPCEKTEMCDDVSVGILWSGEVLDEMNTAIYRGKLEKVESGNSLPSSKDDDAVGRLEGKESSGAKLKPLFARGFLRKRPRDKYNK
ncbi:hypothetical protein RJ639_029297 [Escallonia herrerae]|uniref:USP domain-containing protein n=1 Tax=Escallonia herrerae TaxID=1293975 RepID=A0AA89BG38_9ASTE|nr:hypothetical protein RJ639_029297 [Escallonia herrerae]